MIATASGAMLAGMAEVEPHRIWFGRGGWVVERHDDGTCAVFVRGELLGVYAPEDVASRDVHIAVVMEQASRGRGAGVPGLGRDGWARCDATQARRRTRRRGLHGAVAKLASYGTVYAAYREWRARRAT